MSNDIPAFPIPLNQGETYSGHSICDGMTIRDYFAAKAMQAFINKAPNGTTFGEGSEDTNRKFAVIAYMMAGAMLEARKK